MWHETQLRIYLVKIVLDRLDGSECMCEHLFTFLSG